MSHKLILMNIIPKLYTKIYNNLLENSKIINIIIYHKKKIAIEIV